MDGEGIKGMRRVVPARTRTKSEAGPVAGATAAATAGAADVRSEIPSLSLSRLGKPDFQAEEYLKEALRGTPERGIRQFRKALEEARKAASKNLQKNVYRNYESFVFISKEIWSMERDMQLLRELLHNISEVGDELMEEDDAPATSEARVTRRRTMRMSMANQEDLFKDQLARLWRTIRGAQRLVPFAPGRHVVGDIRNVSELSPSTLQTRQQVDIVVLSDMLLLAARRRHGAHAQTVLVADRSFALSDVTVADVGDAARSGFLVRIVNRAETFLFGFRGADVKDEFLLLISHARAGILGGDAPPPVPGLPAGQAEQLAKAPPANGGGKDDEGARQRSAELLDALDIHIARREFSSAATLVLKLREQAGSAEAARRTADAQTVELARLVLADLRIPCSPRKQAAANVALLRRLGWDKEAKDAFLAARSATIKSRTRQLRLEGNTQLYIRELAIVYFRLIRNTCEWYAEFFTDPTMVSALIAWVRREMAGYAAIFRRHVFHEAQRFQVVASCLGHTLAEVDILGHAGLDLRFMLDQEFFPDLTGCIRSYEARCRALLAKAVAADSLAVAIKVSTANYEGAARLLGSHIPLIASVGKLDEVLTGFGNELRFIARDSLYSQVATSVLAIIESVLKQFLAVLRTGSRTHAQELALLVGTQAVVSWVIPRAAAHLDRIFGRPASDIHSLEQRLEAFPSSLQDVFCQRQAVAMGRASFDFATADFTETHTVDDTMVPSGPMVQLLRTLGTVARELDRWPLPKRAILGSIVDCLFVQMIDHRNWEGTGGTRRVFSHHGVHRLVLDIHFLLRVCGSLVSKSTNTLANRVCEKALRAYFSASGSAPGEMRNKSWYDARVIDAMRSLGFSFPDFGRGFEHRSQQSFDPGMSPTLDAGGDSGEAPGGQPADQSIDQPAGQPAAAADDDDEDDAPLSLQ
ncbi:exocyst complex component exo84 [Coemansia biformis]|uniref:Exocyst complex component EXO84 n=1 Tax=Coemansia biformis TaxID=1286918 RepID=A0A9W7YDG9_9FUNG|nr:exocyst complex component exo84 [Coemansia biformis]